MKSLSEIETTSKRASRAVGFSWGIAEEVGKNMRLLELYGLPGIKNLNKFLIENSDLRHVVRRAFIIEKFPYSEIQDNTISENIIPIDMLRLKLSFFGADKFDPKSDKWLRISMFQGAPLPNELKNFNDYWVYNSLN